jgi:hypothetical protein
MQGSYGLVWIIKDLAFPDPTWRTASPSAAASISGVSRPAYPLPDYACSACASWAASS